MFKFLFFFRCQLIRSGRLYLTQSERCGNRDSRYIHMYCHEWLNALFTFVVPSEASKIIVCTLARFQLVFGDNSDETLIEKKSSATIIQND